jgi:hypothetical protein
LSAVVIATVARVIGDAGGAPVPRASSPASVTPQVPADELSSQAPIMCRLRVAPFQLRPCGSWQARQRSWNSVSSRV